MFKTVKLIKYYVFLFFIGCLLTITPVMALGLKDGFTSGGNLGSFARTSNYGDVQGPEFYVGQLLNGLFALLGIIAVALIMYSGFVWMTARGNDAKVSKAKDNLTEALIGLIILIGSYALTTFLFKIFS
jgi:hypothetical protein